MVPMLTTVTSLHRFEPLRSRRYSHLFHRDSLNFEPMSSEANHLVQTTSESSPLLPTDRTIEPEPPTMSSATFWKIGALYGATAVGLGAFGAHGLKTRISDPAKIANWTTAAHYQVKPLHLVNPISYLPFVDILCYSSHDPIAVPILTFHNSYSTPP